MPLHELEQSEATKTPCVVTSQPKLTGRLARYIQGSSRKPEKVQTTAFQQWTDLLESAVRRFSGRQTSGI